MNKVNDAAGISNHEVTYLFIVFAWSVGKFCAIVTYSRMPDDHRGIIRISDLRDSTFSTVEMVHGFEPRESPFKSLRTHALLRNLNDRKIIRVQ